MVFILLVVHFVLRAAVLRTAILCVVVRFVVLFLIFHNFFTSFLNFLAPKQVRVRILVKRSRELFPRGVVRGNAPYVFGPMKESDSFRFHVERRSLQGKALL
jgi:hypothetical protein